MPASIPSMFPIRLDGAGQATLDAADEPTDTPTQAPGDDQNAARVRRGSPGYTRASSTTA